ncbi:MAG TPA: response regulator [Blastocatellia bacterium]|nr:response regulator [Blastocatellia bacterium]
MPKEKVLVVDDEPMIRWSLREALDSWGYQAIEADSGERALAALTDPQITTVLLDINLPDSSGLDLLREIKRRRPRLAVIMVSAETYYDTAVSALRGGADDFIGKPIHLDELQFAVGRAVEAARQLGAPPMVERLKVLIVGDSVKRTDDLQSVINPNEAEITSIVFPEEWESAAANRYDLALVDLDSELLESLFKVIRANHRQGEILVLVEKSRVAEATNLAGLLPKYRAMPVGRDEMIRLARRRAISAVSRGQAQSLL